MSAAPVLTVVRPGPLTTVQDLGRPGLAALGVAPSGAADLPSLARANALAGNPPGAPTLELTLGGLVLRAEAAVTVALAGAPCALRVTGDEVAGPVVDLAAGAELRVGAPRVGLRSYLAVRGGLDVPPVLGSRSYDTLAALGPPPLRAGDVLAVGALPRWDGEVPAGTDPADVAPLRLVPGPRDDWFAGDAPTVLTGAEWTVTPRSGRTALRLSGPALERSRPGEVPPEGLVAGAVQVPPDGRPVVFLADHPVTGGYPVIGVLLAADVPRAAQVRPGRTVTFALAR